MSYEDAKPSRAQRREIERRRSAVRDVVKDPKGRLVLRTVLGFCDLAGALPQDPQALQRAAGRHDVGRFIAGILIEAAGNMAYVQLLHEEAVEAEKRAKEVDDGPDEV